MSARIGTLPAPRRLGSSPVAREGGYDLAPADGGTRVTIFNVLEGRGLGKLMTPLALSGARRDADAFANRIKTAVEAS